MFVTRMVFFNNALLVLLSLTAGFMVNICKAGVRGVTVTGTGALLVDGAIVIVNAGTDVICAGAIKAVGFGAKI